ncbi:MAG TPA: DegT/DnrJ/EryC1/StrS family aminotransferase [Candidatus Dormibacteraeota bacterium]|nr:DegT/DnrJ/EryC1/StrS family aminotransferase [Candidatus Dormibacteraeota bacterium]
MSSVLEKTESAEILRPVEADLLGDTGGVALEWYGRAATALYRAYSVARQLAGARDQEAEVILPSISCATPANAALLAGVTPRFADVDPATGMPTLASIQQRCTQQTCAVVFIHLFGQTADLRPLAEWCRARKILLIEDLAQALGSRLPDGTSAGSVGDMSVYSFNPTKILECGGGALLIRSKSLADACRELSESDPLPPEIDDARARTLALSYRNLHHSLVGLLRSRAIDEASSAFLKLQPAFRGLYLRHMKHPDALAESWGQLREILRHRYQNAEQYEKALASGPWKRISQWRESGVCWRYSLLFDFPGNLVDFSEAVRQEGFHVSNLYWPVNDFFRRSDECPNADQFARRIVNLWVDRSVDPPWVQKCAESLVRNARQFAS